MGQQQASIQKSQLEQLEDSRYQTFLQKNKYQYQKVLSKGDFSQVVMAFSQKQQCQVAIKILKNLKDQNQVDLQTFKKEFEILQKLKNEKYVLQIVEKIQDDKQGLAAIVAELCDCNLTTIFELNKLSIEQVVALTYQLLKGLLVLQENGIIHSDIKPDNILFNKSKNQFLIADYGLSKIMKDPSSQKTLGSLQGNGQYQSPEVMNGKKPYTISVDIFSIGQLLVEAYIQRKLEGMEWICLKTQSLLTVLPSLQNSPNIEFVNKILCKMVEPNKDNRLQPITLLQNLKALFAINEESLKRLKVQIQQPKKPLKELRTLTVNSIKEIIKGKDYDQLIINLGGNHLGAEGAKNIGMSLEKCQNISSLNLNLSGNDLGAEGAKNIGMSLEKCQNISSLNLILWDNDLGAEGAKNIGMSLEKCQNISSLNLNLSGNHLGAEEAKNIGMSLEKCQNISSLNLNLQINQIGAEGAKNIGMSLEKCQNISSLNLNLSWNQLGAEGAKNIGMSLEKCQNISSLNLNLSINQLGAEGAKNIGMSLEKCQNISSLNLDLSINQLGAEGAKNIGMSLEKCQNISSLNLNLYGNDLGAEGAKNIGMSLEKCQNISSLNLNLWINQLGAEGAKNIGMSLEKCQNISSLNLNLSNNDFNLMEMKTKCLKSKRLVIFALENY